ncbi:transmembrane protein 45B-like [Mercenaria mercenaria]|uniref:transmembrane protein 45B-like n=1 Tax=Mercenaria mercenaria TaxID=6596 RepID=UPI00234E4873|nr:transmembrane protein 45B-like [Mercenaria mercenaria]XP_045179456.2 transmembrane protein 45B-like [Mercenaria mercenaria]XP_045179457.2 transmembrane protein 45B-like [Mercenaria mercenaria]
MGDFAAHTFEGVLFLCVGLWWTFHIFRRYLQTTQTGEQYRSYLSYHVTIKGRHVPFETLFFKTFCPFVGLVTDLLNERFTFINEEGHFIHIVGLQHIVIHTLFVLHGVSDLMEYYKLPTIKGMKYFTFCLSFFWFSLEFFFHSDPNMHKPPLENELHRLGIPLTALVGLAVLAEFYQREQILPQLLRCLCALTLGTWYIYMAHVLFLPTPFPGRLLNPDWDQNDETNVHFIIAAFGLHLIFNLMFMMISFVTMSVCSKFNFFKRLIGEHTNNYSYISLKEESDFTPEKDSLILNEI